MADLNLRRWDFLKLSSKLSALGIYDIKTVEEVYEHVHLIINDSYKLERRIYYGVYKINPIKVWQSEDLDVLNKQALYGEMILEDEYIDILKMHLTADPHFPKNEMEYESIQGYLPRLKKIVQDALVDQLYVNINGFLYNDFGFHNPLIYGENDYKKINALLHEDALCKGRNQPYRLISELIRCAYLRRLDMIRYRAKEADPERLAYLDEKDLRDINVSRITHNFELYDVALELSKSFHKMRELSMRIKHINPSTVIKIIDEVINEKRMIYLKNRKGIIDGNREAFERVKFEKRWRRRDRYPRERGRSREEYPKDRGRSRRSRRSRSRSRDRGRRRSRSRSREPRGPQRMDEGMVGGSTSERYKYKYLKYKYKYKKMKK